MDDGNGSIIQFNYDVGNIVEADATTTNIIIDEASNVSRIIKSVYADHLELYTLDPNDFEKMIAELLAHQGFKVELTKKTRDNGYDILALCHINKYFPVKFLVECKRYGPKNPVGVQIVRAFKEVIETAGASQGIIVTTSYFSPDAKRKQQEIPYRLDLKAKADVMDWVIDYYNSILKR